MRKLIVLNVLVIVLAVYTCATYTFDNKDQDLDDKIAKLVSEMGIEDTLNKREGDGGNCIDECDDIDGDDCNCETEACIIEICGDKVGRALEQLDDAEVEDEVGRALDKLDDAEAEDAREQGGLLQGGLQKKGFLRRRYRRRSISGRYRRTYRRRYYLGKK